MQQLVDAIRDLDNDTCESMYVLNDEDQFQDTNTNMLLTLLRYDRDEFIMDIRQIQAFIQNIRRFYNITDTMITDTMSMQEFDTLNWVDQLKYITPYCMTYEHCGSLFYNIVIELGYETKN